MIIGSIHLEDLTIINIYAPNNKYMKQKLAKLKGEINDSTVIVGDFNAQLSITEKTIIWKIKRKQKT